MKIEEITIKRLTASEGHWITDGKNYGKTIGVPGNKSLDCYYEITEEEYQAILAEREGDVE